MFQIFALLIVATTPIATTPAIKAAPVKQSIPAQPADCKGKTFATLAEAMQSGCCSWHNGVCGCVGGRKTCCDGTTSPSCKC